MKGLKIRSQYKTDFKHLIKINYKLIEFTYMLSFSICNTNLLYVTHRSTGIEIWPEPEFDRNFVNRQILLMKMTTRLIIIILDCAGYISTFKAVIVVTAAL